MPAAREVVLMGRASVKKAESAAQAMRHFHGQVLGDVVKFKSNPYRPEVASQLAPPGAALHKKKKQYARTTEIGKGQIENFRNKFCIYNKRLAA